MLDFCARVAGSILGRVGAKDFFLACYIFLPLHIEICPRISESTRITGNETQGGLMHMWVIYVGAPNVTGEEKIFSPNPAEDRTRDPSHKNPTLYRIAIKAGLYRKAVQVFIYVYPVTYGKCTALHE